MKKEQIQLHIQQVTDYLWFFCKWLVISILCGAIIGLIETGFCYSIDYVTNLRMTHPFIILGLPIGGLLILGIYKIFNNENDAGTNLILTSIHSGGDVPLRMAPCIFLSAIITHLFGGSAGRAGATLQIGGSIGSSIGKLLRLDETDRHMITMCGMSAAFSVLFQVPMAAAIFPLEMVNVGSMQYIALFPCVVAARTAYEIASLCGLAPTSFLFTDIPSFSLQTGCMTVALAACCALVSVLFCVSLQKARQFYSYFKNAYLRIAVGGIIVIILTVLVGSQAYNGAGMNFIGAFMERNSVFPFAFLLKILFTACTMGAGFKGGEIGPAFYIGASFGCLFGMLGGCSVGLCTAVGMAAVFCGVTNSPLTSLLISFEFFGYEGMPYYLLAIAVSYMLSGNFGIYSGQKILRKVHISKNIR